MRPSRRLGTLAAAATLATTAATGAAPAYAYFDTAHGRVPVYVTHTVVSAPARDDTADWPPIAAGGAAALALAAAVALRSTRTRSRVGA